MSRRRRCARAGEHLLVDAMDDGSTSAALPAGCETITRGQPAVMKRSKSARVEYWPEHSITTSAPNPAQSTPSGVLACDTAIGRPSTISLPSLVSTVPGKRPWLESKRVR
jgi:hypothetical protein